ncbi:alpha/beta hydrolase fold domain-containing protein [Pirellulaceae bacterium SH449]
MQTEISCPTSGTGPLSYAKCLVAMLGLSGILFSVVGMAGEPVVRPSVRIKTETDVVYGDKNEPMHRVDLYFPAEAGSAESKLPVVLMIHGGAWTAGDKTYDRIHARKLAARGYFVAVINYRLAPAHKFPAQLEDCRLALSWIQDQALTRNLDLERVAAWGYSAGGHLTALLALMTSPESAELPRLRACVCGGTPFDLTNLPGDSSVLAGVFGSTPAEAPEVYRNASPISHVQRVAPPMFVFHGGKDWLVPNKNAVKMCKLLKENEIEYAYCEVDGKGHLATFADLSIAEKSFDFLDKILKPDSAWRTEENQSK